MKKLIYLVLIFILQLVQAYSQEIEWQNTIQGITYDYCYSVERCIEGGYIVGGHSSSDIGGDKTENSDIQDYWILRIDDSGNILWQNTIGGDDAEFVESVQQTSDGGYIIGGWSASHISGDKTEDTQGGWDYWVIKTDALGNIQWQNTIGGSDTDKLVCVRQTNDGGYILGGQSNSPISGDKTENFMSYDMWIIKLDESGNIEWQNTIGGDSTDYFGGIVQTADGGYITGGQSMSGISGDKTEAVMGGSDFWVVKLNASGNIEWDNTIGGSSGDALLSLDLANDGGIILAGNSASPISGDKTENPIGVTDYWVVKIDAMGNVLWDNTIGGDQGEVIYSIKSTSDGGYVATGTSTSNAFGDKTENCIGSNDYWVIKLDSEGNLRWENTIGGTLSDVSRSICESRDGDFLVSGYSYSGINGDKTENVLGVMDYWVLKLGYDYNMIYGKIYYDFNSNSIQDVGEPTIANKKITEAGSGRFTFSDSDGNYSLSVFDTGNVSISAQPINYYICNPATHNLYFNAFQLSDSLNDFAFQPGPPVYDLSVALVPVSVFRNGIDAYYYLLWSNTGNTSNAGTVVFYPDSDITFVTASIPPDLVTPDSVVWDLGTIAPNQSGNIFVTVHVDIGLPLNTLINSSVRIDPVTGDANPVNNYFSWEVFTVNSYDPNDILVSRDTVFNYELVNPPWLEYIIRFQNTGNAPAINVHVLNKIQPLLDLSTFEFLDASHPIEISYSEVTGYMDFGFDNILLPDSNSNEPESHGYVRYRIKPISALIAGDSVRNSAAIYFDFNEPVITNTAVTEIVLPTGVYETNISGGNLHIYPNPAKTVLSVETDNLTSPGNRLIVSDAIGRIIFSKPISDSKLQIDISSWSRGIYFIQLETDNEVSRNRFVKD